MCASPRIHKTWTQAHAYTKHGRKRTHTPAGLHASPFSGVSYHCANRVLVRQLPLHDVSANLHFSVRMGPEATIGLNEVVIHHPQHAEAGILRIGVLGKREVEARFEPVCVRPGRL